MVKVTVEGDTDTILSFETKVVTVTEEIENHLHTLTTTTIEIISRSAPLFPLPPTPPSTPPAPSTDTTLSAPATSPLVFGSSRKSKLLRKTRKAKSEVFYPTCFSGVRYITYTGKSWIFPPPGSTEARDLIEQSSLSPLSLSLPLSLEQQYCVESPAKP